MKAMRRWPAASSSDVSVRAPVRFAAMTVSTASWGSARSKSTSGRPASTAVWRLPVSMDDAGRHEESVDALRELHTDRLGLDLGILVGVREDEVESGGGRDIRRPPRRLREERILDVADHDSDRVRTTGAHRAWRARWGGSRAARRCCKHPVTDRFAHGAVVSEGSGRRRLRDAGRGSDIAHRHLATAACRCRPCPLADHSTCLSELCVDLRSHPRVLSLETN